MDPAAPPGYFDTHCHLDAAEFAADRAAVVDDAVAAGVVEWLIPAVEVANFAAVNALCRNPAGRDPSGADPGASARREIFGNAAFGIHPLYTPGASEGDIARLRAWLRRERPSAVGEIGLDGFVPGVDMHRQEWFFVEQLKLAREFDLPVVLHLRRAQDLVYKHLRRIGVRGGFAHAFNGSRQQAEQFIRLGCRLGFGGAMTYAGSTRIRQLARELPLEAIVLETDSPDIPPAWLAGGRNTPAELPRIAAVLAELRGVAVDTIATVTSANARAVLGADG